MCHSLFLCSELGQGWHRELVGHSKVADGSNNVVGAAPRPLLADGISFSNANWSFAPLEGRIGNVTRWCQELDESDLSVLHFLSKFHKGHAGFFECGSIQAATKVDVFEVVNEAVESVCD